MATDNAVAVATAEEAMEEEGLLRLRVITPDNDDIWLEGIAVRTCVGSFGG